MLEQAVTLTSWISELKKQNSFSSSIAFFVETADFPVLYFEYQDSQACLSLKHGRHLPVMDSVCLRLHESDPDFDPTALYDSKKIPVFHHKVQKLFGAQEYQCFPLVFNKRVAGIFAFFSNASVTRDRFFILDNYVKDFLWREKWRQDGSVDESTGCLNQRAFFKQLFVEFSRARRLRLPLSLLLLRLDQMDTLKTVYGSYKAEIFVKSLANNLIQDSRAYDIFGSWPTGYLGLILPHTSERGAGMKAEKIRWSVQSADFSKVFPSHGNLTLSLGLAEYPCVNRSADSLFQSTLKALSFANRECGGNMTAVATPAVGFKPDFAVQDTVNNLRDLA